MTFEQAYPLASILRAVTIPSKGGDTLWANTVTAYEDLPQDLKQLADGLWALHTNAYDYATRRPDADEERLKYHQEIFSSTIYETEHPVVRVHPETGERSLLLGGFVQKLLGHSAAETQALLSIFQNYVIRPENTVRWRWTVGDVAIWDNRATQHYGVGDFNEPRELYRVTVDGDVPVGVDGRRSVAKRKETNPALLRAAAE